MQSFVHIPPDEVSLTRRSLNVSLFPM